MAGLSSRFDGITCLVPLATSERLQVALARLTTCHPHNFAVEMDTSTPSIWTTDLGAQCIAEALAEHDNAR